MSSVPGRSRSHNRRPRLALILGLGAVLAAHQSEAVEIDTACLHQLVEKGGPSWKKVLSSLDNVATVIAEHRETFEKGQTSPSVTDAIFKVDRDLAKSYRLVETTDSDTGSVNIRMFNPRYYAWVDRMNHALKYTFIKGQVNGSGPEENLDDPTDRLCRYYLESGFTVRGIRLSELLSGKDFRLRSVGYVEREDDAPKRVRIESEYTGATAPWRRTNGIYWAELNPQNSWLIDRGGVKFLSTAKEEGQKLTYQSGEDGVPFPRELSTFIADRDIQYKHQFTFKFSKPTKTQRTAEEFLLPYYGIPESVLDSRGRRLWPRILLFNAGVVGLIICYILIKTTRRNPNSKSVH